MNKELHNRLEKTANIEAIKDTSKGRYREDYYINALADHENGFREGFVTGAEFGYKEAVKMAKEWFNSKTYCLIIDAVKGITLGEQFENDMNKLLEE